MAKSATFGFHGSLNDFLSPSKKETAIHYPFNDEPAIKHAIETIGIPHPEVELIKVNGLQVDFYYPLQDGDQVEVFPFFSSHQPSEEKFILDVHLGKLAKALRLFGFDTCYENHYSDKMIIELAEPEKRIILTRDRNLLKHKLVKTGYWIRSEFVETQLLEVIKRFDLKNKFRFFKRCVECNGQIVPVKKRDILHLLLPKTILYYNEFFQCTNCRRIYWRGSHYQEIENFINQIQVRLDN
jgi:uncharacterized protein